MDLVTDEATPDVVAAPDLFRLRTWTAGDEAFVRDSWRRKHEDQEASRYPNLHEYVRAQKAIVTECLRSSTVTVACLPDHEDQILGWVCHKRFADRRGREIAVVHFLYCKTCFAVPEFGVVEALWSAATQGAASTYHTHWFDAARGRALRCSAP